MSDHATEIAALRGPQSDAEAIEELLYEIQGLRALDALRQVVMTAAGQPTASQVVAPHDGARVRLAIKSALYRVTDPMQLSLLRIGAQVIATIDRNSHRGRP